MDENSVCKSLYSGWDTTLLGRLMVVMLELMAVDCLDSWRFTTFLWLVDYGFDKFTFGGFLMF